MFIDVIAAECAIFELKTVESLHDRHRAQLLQYLLLCDLGHGKLVNMRTEGVQHEFVNACLSTAERRQFDIVKSDWCDLGGPRLADWFSALLSDLGTGLELTLYEDALTHLLGGEEQVLKPIPVLSDGRLIGTQWFRLMLPDVAFKVTTLGGDLDAFAVHARRLLAHTNLSAIQWINVGRREVVFRTLRRE